MAFSFAMNRDIGLSFLTLNVIVTQQFLEPLVKSTMEKHRSAHTPLVVSQGVALYRAVRTIEDTLIKKVAPGSMARFNIDFYYHHFSDYLIECVAGLNVAVSNPR